LADRQFHGNLFAPATADDRQVHYFASFGLCDRFSEVGDISRPLPVHRDDQLA
jgi:hypothetical protein